MSGFVVYGPKSDDHDSSRSKNRLFLNLNRRQDVVYLKLAILLFLDFLFLCETRSTVATFSQHLYKPIATDGTSTPSHSQGCGPGPVRTMSDL